MRTLFIAAAIVVLGASSAFAGEPWRPFETTDQARQRHNADRYEKQQRNGTPLGGYSERLGDPAPRGTERPGYTSPERHGPGSGGDYNGRRRY